MIDILGLDSSTSDRVNPAVGTIESSEVAIALVVTWGLSRIGCRQSSWNDFLAASRSHQHSRLGLNIRGAT